MKVLMLANHFNFGGVTAYILNLSRFIKQKNNMDVVVASRGGELEEELKSAGITHVRIPLTTKCEGSPKVFFSAYRLAPFIRDNQIDLIHAHTRVTQVLAALVSKKTGRPYVVTCHGYFKPRLSRRLFPCWGKRVIAVSDQVRQHLIQDFHLEPSRIELIYNGVDLEKFKAHSDEERWAEKLRLGLDPDKKIVGHIGRLSSVKGQKFLVLAAAEILKKRRDIQFLLVGDGDEAGPLKNLIHELGLDHVVFMRSSVIHTSLVLSLMDVFVMPSLQEGLGIAILEAQAQGVPVVASRVGGIPTIVIDGVTGLLCSAGDAGAIAANICKMLDQDSLRNSLVYQAKNHIMENFSLDLMAKKTCALYGELLCRG